MEEGNIPILSGKRHKSINILCIACLWIVYLLTITFNALSASGNSTFYFSNQVNLSAKYELDTTPAGWTFSIWSVIYLFISITLVFYIFTILKRTPGNDYMYLNPVVASPAYCLFYSINLLTNVAWTFLWDRELLMVSFFALAGVAMTNIIALSILSRNIEIKDHLMKREQPKLYWTYICMAFNGQGVYCTWTIIASTLNFTIFLQYGEGINKETSADINLASLLVICVGWASIEIACLDKFTRFLITPYIVVIWALGGIIDKKNSDPNVSDKTKTFLTSLMLIAINLLLVKICFIVYRQIKKPFNKI